MMFLSQRSKILLVCLMASSSTISAAVNGRLEMPSSMLLAKTCSPASISVVNGYSAECSSIILVLDSRDARAPSCCEYWDYSSASAASRSSSGPWLSSSSLSKYAPSTRSLLSYSAIGIPVVALTPLGSGPYRD